MDEYYRAIANLPEPLCSELGQLNPQAAPFVQEIRLRAGQPLQFVVRGRLVACTKLLPAARHAAMVDKAALEGCFVALCRHSVYAYEAELRQGFLTVPGGDRVGVAGVRGPAGFSCVTSLNIRVARWVVCELPPAVIQALAGLGGGILVAGAPGSGKTTFLRSMISYLSRGDRVFCVVDERGELLGCNTGGLPQGKSLKCDVYTQYPKTQAIGMALRCMNPQAIICDELGTAEDVRAVESALSAGVVFYASVHCDDLAALEKKPQLAGLIKTGAFKTAVLLDGRAAPGTVARAVTL